MDVRVSEVGAHVSVCAVAGEEIENKPNKIKANAPDKIKLVFKNLGILFLDNY